MLIDRCIDLVKGLGSLFPRACVTQATKTNHSVAHTFYLPTRPGQVWPKDASIDAEGAQQRLRDGYQDQIKQHMQAQGVRACWFV